MNRIIAHQLLIGKTYLGEVRAKDVLRAYDFVVPEGRMVSTVAEAIEAASQLGYPLAMKIVSPDIIHKSDVGGVKLNLTTQREVADSFELMMIRVAREAPRRLSRGGLPRAHGGQGPGGHPGHELGIRSSARCSCSGWAASSWRSCTMSRFYLAPITSAEAMSMLMGTRSYKLLEGFRGEARVDIAVIAEALQRISQLVTDFPQIAELDINPFMVGATGRGVGRGRRTHPAWLPVRAAIMAETCRSQRRCPQFRRRLADTGTRTMVMTAERAVAKIRPGQRVFIATGGAQPLRLVRPWSPAMQSLPTCRFCNR